MNGPCIVDAEISARYRRSHALLLKKYPHLERDVAEALDLILHEPKFACSARAIPGFNGLVYKYRIKSRDLRRGSSGGFRLLAFLDADRRRLVPLWLYTHDQFENQPPGSDIQEELRKILDPPDEPANRPDEPAS